MLPNSDVYGTQETWIDSKYFYFIGDGDTETRTIKPKTANFADNSGTLAKGAAQGKTPVDESIDKTICPCGQDPVYSCLGSIALFKNKQDVDDNKIPDTVVLRTTPCNWFLYDGTGVGVSTTEGHLRDRTNSQQRWAPDSDLQNNWNGYVTPFVYWQLKSMLIHIRVACITGYDGIGYPEFTWRTLYDWKQNYSSQKICDIKLSFRGFSSISGTNITYTSNSNTSTGDFGGIACLDDMDGVIDYAAFGTAREVSFHLLGKLRGNYYNTSSTFYMPCFNMFENMVYKSLSSSSPDYGWCLWGEIPYSADNYEKIMQMTACFGIPFTDKDKVTFPLSYIDDDLYLPVIDDEGITHGEYTHGTGNEDNDLYEADSIRTKDYDPAKPVDPNVYSDTTTFNTVDFKQSFTRRYILTAAQVGQLADELWDAMATKDPGELTSDFTIDEFLTNNPVDCVVSLKYFPCTFSDIAPAVVHLGKYQTNIAATALGTSVRVIDFDPIQVWRHFDDFRDFEPYTQIQMYIPLCGVVDLATAEVMGNYVSVKLAIDITTGAATGYVLVSKTGTGGICIATIQGNAAIDIPVSGLQSASLQEAVFDSISNYMQTSISTGSYTSGLFNSNPSKLGMLGNIAMNKVSVGGVARGTQSPLGAINTALSFVDALNPVKLQQQVASSVLENQAAIYDLQHIQMPTRMIGSASPLLSTVIELQCRLIIYRPKTDEGALTSYGDTVGYACLMSGVVGQFTGLTVGTIDVTGINASDDEKKAIASAFASGVYL